MLSEARHAACATNRSGVGLGSGNPSERIDAVDALRGLALFGVMAIHATMEFRVSIFDQFPRAARVRRSMTYAAPAGHRHLLLAVATTGIVIGAALTVAEPMQAQWLSITGSPRWNGCCAA
ncbi:MAG: hypothetical protein JWQ07_6016 [Ramlibacter sp.]|jgi:hypothetical protein|nr:hypothetical protein [Ramlibacter sp.]